MSPKFMLLESNPLLEIDDGVYKLSNEPYRDSSLSDKLQALIRDRFSSAVDKSLFSLDLSNLGAKEFNANHQLNQLTESSTVFNFLNGFNLEGVSTVLDLSEDTGGITHFLADHVAYVDSIKQDIGLAKLAATRCAKKHNVKHISANLDNINFPSQCYDLIIIAQLESLTLKEVVIATASSIVVNWRASNNRGQ